MGKYFVNGIDSADGEATTTKSFVVASWIDMSLERRCCPLSQTMLDPSVAEEQPGGPHSHWESKSICF